VFYLVSVRGRAGKYNQHLLAPSESRIIGSLHKEVKLDIVISTFVMLPTKMCGFMSEYRYIRHITRKAVS